MLFEDDQLALMLRVATWEELLRKTKSGNTLDSIQLAAQENGNTFLSERVAKVQAAVSGA